MTKFGPQTLRRTSSLPDFVETPVQTMEHPIENTDEDGFILNTNKKKTSRHAITNTNPAVETSNSFAVLEDTVDVDDENDTEQTEVDNQLTKILTTIKAQPQKITGNLLKVLTGQYTNEIQIRYANNALLIKIKSEQAKNHVTQQLGKEKSHMKH